MAKGLSPVQEACALAGATIACLVPFLTKPLHVDDPLFYWTARRLTAHPFDPYGFQVNWYLSSWSMGDVLNHPPGMAYFLAAAGTIGGWSPLALHAACLLPAIGVVLGAWALARRWSGHPFLCGLLVLTAPGFLVSATTLMSDVTMLALWLLTTILWVDGIERSDARRLGAAGVAAAACALTKFPGFSVVPLLALYAVLHKGWGRWAWALAPPVLALLAYQWWTASVYGHGLITVATSYAAREGGDRSAREALIALSYLGGSFLAAVPLLFALVDARVATAILSVGAAAGAVAFSSWTPTGAVAMDAWSIALHFAVFISAGVAVLVLAARDAWRRRSAAATTLAAWVLGTALFAGFINWTTNVRSVLPIVPAAALIVARAVDDRGWTAALRTAIAGVLATSLVLSLWIARGDYAFASVEQQAVEAVRDRTVSHQGTLWFMGHWGFQVGMESIGGRPVDAETTRFVPGDVVVVPLDNTNVVPLPAEMPVQRQRLEIGGAKGGTTICGRCGAGFYSSFWGVLPYRVDPRPSQRFDVVEVLPAK